MPKIDYVDFIPRKRNYIHWAVILDELFSSDRTIMKVELFEGETKPKSAQTAIINCAHRNGYKIRTSIVDGVLYIQKKKSN